ncbi:MAG: hypothetical protein Q8K26_01320 [Candidatus Gracilibacteria bacterium]|nr:hypothetical protein [Candidatus Gracilibacteria bacterium]
MYPIPPTETLVETKTCKHCGVSFPITDKDLEFYEKVSPVFNGQKYQIPTPTLCPDCRQQRRLSFRNERKLYKRKCDATGRDIISIYSPDKPFKVYHQDFWWSDKWDAMEYGRDFDFTRGFFEQFGELWKGIPLPSLYQTGCEGSEYTNHSYYNKDCYLVTGANENINVYYSSELGNCTDCMDVYIAIKSQFCYSNINIESCYNVYYSINTQQSRDSWFLYNCRGCENCFMCENLSNRSYCIRNKQFSKEEYELEMNIDMRKNYPKLSIEFLERKERTPHINLIQVNSENCTGDEIYNSQNCKECYTVFNAKNTAYIWSDLNPIDAYDCYGTMECPLSMEGVSFMKGTRKAFGFMCVEGSDVYYSVLCYNSSHLFACIGLRNKSYCIFNKQYTREEYEELVPKIIEHMRKTGEWGEFFPSSLSPFGYNETVAQEYYPLDRRDEKFFVSTSGKPIFNWSDYEAPFPRVEKIIPAAKLPEDISKIPDDILNWAIECEVTGKPFRIIKQELEFYRKHNLPVPRRHPDQRHLDRMSLRNPRKLFERKCDKCGVEMMTTYSNERKEIVYCEGCYNKEIL